MNIKSKLLVLVLFLSSITVFAEDCRQSRNPNIGVIEDISFRPQSKFWQLKQRKILSYPGGFLHFTDFYRKEYAFEAGEQIVGITEFDANKYLIFTTNERGFSAYLWDTALLEFKLFQRVVLSYEEEEKRSVLSPLVDVYIIDGKAYLLSNFHLRVATIENIARSEAVEYEEEHKLFERTEKRAVGLFYELEQKRLHMFTANADGGRVERASEYYSLATKSVLPNRDNKIFGHSFNQIHYLQIRPSQKVLKNTKKFMFFSKDKDTHLYFTELNEFSSLSDYAHNVVHLRDGRSSVSYFNRGVEIFDTNGEKYCEIRFKFQDSMLIEERGFFRFAFWGLEPSGNLVRMSFR